MSAAEKLVVEVAETEEKKVFYCCACLSKHGAPFALCGCCGSLGTVKEASPAILAIYEQGERMASKRREQRPVQVQTDGDGTAFNPAIFEGLSGGQYGTSPYGPSAVTRSTHPDPYEKQCKDCLAGNLKEAKFCRECGESFAPSDGEEAECECGCINAPDARFCKECGEPLDEEDEDDEDDGRIVYKAVAPAETKTLKGIKTAAVQRVDTGCPVLNHVLNGGLPLHKCLMLASQPGVGKSTKLREMAAYLLSLGKKVMWASGEEDEESIKGEFKRLGLYAKYKETSKLITCSSTDTDAIIAAAHAKGVEFLFVDSIPVLRSRFSKGMAGKEAQLIYAARELMHAAHGVERYAGKEKLTVMAIMHGTKNGDMSGANTAMHWTDGAIYMEHIDPHTLEKLRNQKKPSGFVEIRIHGKYRGGPATNLGYYQMTPDKGLVPYYPVAVDGDDEESGAPGVARRPTVDAASKPGSKKGRRKSSG